MPPPGPASVRRSECSRDYCSDRSEMSVGRGSMENMARQSPPTGKHLTGDDPLDRFSPATRAWFDGAFAEPTQAQAGAWRAIGKGEDTLVVAPTGSGKTLAAFLWAIDRLAGGALPAGGDGAEGGTPGR